MILRAGKKECSIFHTLGRKGLTALSISFAMILFCGSIRAGAQDDSSPQYPQQEQTQEQDQQGSQQTPWNVARVSFVQGDVQITSGGKTEFSQAVANMPLVEGAQLQTGADGQAEVEFGDGSVARLTPNSALQLNRMGQDQVQVQQNSGLGYYELNVGQGHPAFTVQFASGAITPTENVILRLDLDSAPQIGVIAGGIQVSGEGVQGVAVNENQSLIFNPGNGTPYSIAQGMDQNSWDQWNGDRDQAVSQEAAQQTPVRDDSGNAGDENWNDLDAAGNWYPVEGTGNVWVPSGVDAGWDPFGYGYWGFYPGIGYTWISGYSWGWLPYHCGNWGYYSFGWGWAPGGCGNAWRPVVGVRGYPGYFIPSRPVFHGHHPIPSQRFVAVNRGPRATGNWGPGHQGMPYANHQAPLNMGGGHELAPINRMPFATHAANGSNRGTSPGARIALTGSAGPGQPRIQNQTFQHAPGATFNGQRQPDFQPGGAQTHQQHVNAPNPHVDQGNPRVDQVQPRVNPSASQPGPAQSRDPSRYSYAPQPGGAPVAPHYSAPPTEQTHAPAPPPPPQHYNPPPQQQPQRYNPPPQQQPHYNPPPQQQQPHYNPPPQQQPHYNPPPQQQQPHYNPPPQQPHYSPGPSGGGGGQHGRR